MADYIATCRVAPREGAAGTGQSGAHGGPRMMDAGLRNRAMAIRTWLTSNYAAARSAGDAAALHATLAPAQYG